MPTLQIAFFSTDAHSTDSVVTYPSANPTQCSIATEGDCTTVTVHISHWQGLNKGHSWKFQLSFT